ncbi:condensation domain-containing protein, partial [Legionella oakridgensis]|uniref:condensation domain-containing protein n=1 Tax=Legionella oakridgensis TaxID=29423 RepID=UPI000568D6BB
PRHYTLVKTIHHSIMDGWSRPILFNCIHHYYRMLIEGRQPEVIEDRTYVEAQTYITQHQACIKSYWEDRLVGITHGNDINVLLSRPVDLERERLVHIPQVHQLEITGELYDTLKNFTHEKGLTFNVLTQFAWHK